VRNKKNEKRIKY